MPTSGRSVVDLSTPFQFGTVAQNALLELVGESSTYIHTHTS